MSRSHLPATGTVHPGTWLCYALALPWYCPLSGQPLVQPLVRPITKPRCALTSSFVIIKTFCLRISRTNYTVDHSCWDADGVIYHLKIANLSGVPGDFDDNEYSNQNFIIDDDEHANHYYTVDELVAMNDWWY